MPYQVLEASNNAPSTPAEEVKQEVAQGEIEATKEVDAGTEQEANKEPKPEPTEAEKVKAAMQKRIDRQTAAYKAQEERLRQLESQLNEMAAKAPKADNAPKQDDYKTYEEWEEATLEYKANQRVQERIKAEKEKELQTAQQRKQQEVRRMFEERENAFRSTTPDYDRVANEAVNELNTLAQSGVDITSLRDMVMSFDNPPELLYQLGKEPSLIEELVNMQPTKAMRELVKLEIAIKGTVKPEPKRAPNPIETLGAKAGGVKPLSQMSAKEISEWAKGKS
jgi:hypothetical protein